MSLPDKFHISWQNDIASFTLAADATVETAYPLTNCQSSNASEWAAFDMTAETAVAITGSTATVRTATCFAVHNHTCPDETTVRLRLYAGEGQTGTVVYDSNATDVMHNIPFGSVIAGIDAIEGNFEDGGHMKTHFSLWFESVEYKSFRIDIANAGGFTDDALLVDKLWLGYAHALEHTANWGFQSTQINDSIHQRKPYGGMETIEGCVRRGMNLEFVAESADRHVIRHILDRARKGGDLLCTMDPNDTLSMNYETTSIYRRLNDTSFTAAYYDGNPFGLALEEN